MKDCCETCRSIDDCLMPDCPCHTEECKHGLPKDRIHCLTCHSQTRQDDWEKDFEAVFHQYLHPHDHPMTLDNCKFFVARLLASQRKELLKRLESKMYDIHEPCIGDECCVGKSTRLLARLTDQ